MRFVRSLGERMLDRLLPTATASAIECDRVWYGNPRKCCTVCYYPSTGTFRYSACRTQSTCP